MRSRWIWLAVLALGAVVAWGTMSARRAAADAALAAATNEVCLVAPLLPFDPKAGLSLHSARPLAVDARCPVCGMYPARSPEWAAQAVFKDGATQFFDSPLSLWVYLQDVPRYAVGRQADEVMATYVTDTDSGAWIDARTAFFVSGSTAVGPMRAGNLPAFSSKPKSLAFAQRRGGEVLSASDISPALLRRLSGSRSHLH